MLEEDYNYFSDDSVGAFLIKDYSLSVDLLLEREEKTKNDTCLKNQKAGKPKKKKFNKSLWTLNENLKYCEFVRENIGLFQAEKNDRRLSKINKQMSSFVKTRSSDQCRSHHQKMLKFHGSIWEIVQHISYLRSTVEKGKRDSDVPIRIRKRVPKVSIESVAPMVPITVMVPTVSFQIQNFIANVLDLKSSQSNKN